MGQLEIFSLSNLINYFPFQGIQSKKRKKSGIFFTITAGGGVEGRGARLCGPRIQHYHLFDVDPYLKQSGKDNGTPIGMYEFDS